MGVLNRLYLFAFGYFRIAVEERQRACLLNLFVKEKIMGYPDEGGFVVAARYRKRLLRALACQGINVSVTDVCGLPAYFRKHHKRIGLLLGACGVVLMMIASRSVVWRVEVSGNEIITMEEIEADLAQIGFGVGSLIKAADFQELSAALRLRHTEIAHADIYCIGTVAHVRVREADIPRTEEKDTSPMHLVADYDAVITGFDVRHGTVAVKEGQVIKKESFWSVAL